MTRKFGRAVVAFACALGLVLAAGADADAGRKKKKKKKKAPAAHVLNAEQAKAVMSFLGAFKFGMSKKDVIKVVTKQVRERYAERIAKTTDVYAQDKLRRQAKNEVKRFMKSYVAFEGKKTGWDVSIVDDQFRHKTDEAMMLLWETHEGRDQRRFFFFHRDRLYKTFIALNTSAIPGAAEKGFDYFADLMRARFGPGNDVNGRIEWRNKAVRAQAINKLGLYGAFCLTIADRAAEADLEDVRKANMVAEKKNNIIDAIKDDGNEPDISANQNAIDNIVGN